MKYSLEIWHLLYKKLYHEAAHNEATYIFTKISIKWTKIYTINCKYIKHCHLIIENHSVNVILEQKNCHANVENKRKPNLSKIISNCQFFKNKYRNSYNYYYLLSSKLKRTDFTYFCDWKIRRSDLWMK